MAKTPLAMELLMVPFSICVIKPASDSGGLNGTCGIDWPRSLSVRSSSPMIQLLATFEFPAALAVASK